MCKCLSTAARIALACTLTLCAQGPHPAVPLEPAGAIIDAFQSHAIVALSEGSHNNEQGHAFRLELIRDPRFALIVNDIVVESGNSRYQDIMDRFVQGESIPEALLRRVWQDTTQSEAVWDVPIYEEFFRAVRAVNARLPRERRLRVLLGDPPINWENVHSREDWLLQQTRRDRFPADLIQREVLSKGRRALLIWGGNHFLRRWPIGSSDRQPSTIVTLIGPTAQSDIFTIWTHTGGNDLRTLQSNVATWHAPSLALIKGTTLGEASYGFYLSKEAGGAPAGGDSPHMEDEFDAVLYLGEPSAVTYSRLSPSLCAETAYMEMRFSRMAISDPPDLPVPPGVLRPADGLRQYCAGVTRK